MDADFLKKYFKYHNAIINDKTFNSNTKMKEPKLAHPTRPDVGVGEDIHQVINPSWDEAKKKEKIIPEQETLKGKDLLRRVYGGNKINTSQLVEKFETHLENHLERGDDVQEELDSIKGGGKEITANKIQKNDKIWEFSNPITAQKNATKFYKQDIYRSTKKDKKYMIKNADGKLIHFGAMNYQDFTKTGNQKRRENYLKRASNIKGDWKNNPFSPNALSMRILW